MESKSKLNPQCLYPMAGLLDRLWAFSRTEPQGTTSDYSEFSAHV
jgi:hypothetical protein